LVLSANSVASSYVTFEWAYALGKGKTVIPIKLTECSVHPRLETIQHLDFSIPGASPWDSLIRRIREIEAVEAAEPASTAGVIRSGLANYDIYVNAILSYLRQRGHQMVSFERLGLGICRGFTDQQFNELILTNSTVFRHAMLAGNKPGLAK